MSKLPLKILRSDLIGNLQGNYEMSTQYIVRISINGIQYHKGAFLQV